MFIDTNVLVQSRSIEAPEYFHARAMLVRASTEASSLRISRQIIREYLAVITRPQSWAAATPMEEALDDIDWMRETFEILEDGPEVTEALITLCREVPVGGRQFHDANIVATMLAHGERRLLTFNTADFRRYSDRIVLVNA